MKLLKSNKKSNKVEVIFERHYYYHPSDTDCFRCQLTICITTDNVDNEIPAEIQSARKLVDAYLYSCWGSNMPDTLQKRCKKKYFSNAESWAALEKEVVAYENDVVKTLKEVKQDNNYNIANMPKDKSVKVKI